MKRALSANDAFGADIVQFQGSLSGVCTFDPVTNAECNTTGTRELFRPSVISVYPNPTSSAVHVAADARPDYLMLYTIDGKKIWQNDSPYQNSVVDLSFLPNGIYILAASVNGSISQHKIVYSH